MIVDLVACMLILPWLEAGPASGAMLQMDIPRDAIYAPADLRINLTVTRAARLEGPYRLRIVTSTAEGTIHEREMTLLRGRKGSCELSFPRVRKIIEVRCRAELSIGGEVIEACERPVSLWPPRCSCTVAQACVEFWAFDTSGIVQKRLSALGVDAADAVFQPVRDFGTPGVVFVGEELDPQCLRMILDRVKMTDGKTVTVVMRQKQFPEEPEVSTTRDQRPGAAPMPGSVLLRGLTGRDVLGLLRDAEAVQIRHRPGCSVTSHVTGVSCDDSSVSSYLCVVQKADHTTLYCQLPSTDGNDPRQMTLLHNLVQFASEQIALPGASDIERVKR